MLLLANKCPKLSANHQKLGKEPETDSLPWFSGGTSPDNTWSQFSGLLNCETINFYPLSHLVCGILLWQPQETNILVLMKN